MPGGRAKSRETNRIVTASTRPPAASRASGGVRGGADSASGVGIQVSAVGHLLGAMASGRMKNLRPVGLLVGLAIWKILKRLF